MYDLIIIGAGVIGASIARVLSKYDLKILVLEKENDVGDGASGANSAIVHSGYDPIPGTLKAKLNVKGNQMFAQLCQDLDVDFIQNGSLTLALDDQEVETLESLAQRAKINGVEVKILDHQQLKAIEPNITRQVKKGLLAPSTGIVNPFELTVALMENAIDNGVELKLNAEVINIIKEDNGYQVITKQQSYHTQRVINAAGCFSDHISEMVVPKYFSIIPRSGQYFVLDNFDNQYVHHVLFNVPSAKGKGILVSPTTRYNYLVGPSSEKVRDPMDVSTDSETLNNVLKNAYRLVEQIPLNHVIRVFSGVRAVSDTNDFIIEEVIPGFINVAGIQSPGLTSAPAIALMVEEMLPKFNLKNDYKLTRRPLYRYCLADPIKRQQLISQNPEFGQMVCRCQEVSVAEIKDAIHRNCGATTLKGIKKRVRPGFGKCQGGFCEPKVLKILAEELKVDEYQLDYSRAGSKVLLKGDDHE